MADPGPSHAFTRRLIADGMLIESTCKFCGAVIVGKAADDDLLNKEKRHLKICTKIPRE